MVYLIDLRRLPLGMFTREYSRMLPVYKVTKAMQVDGQTCMHTHTHIQLSNKGRAGCS